MKKYLLMHIGFEQPTPEIMAAWRKWFEDAGPKTIENIGLRNGREIGRDGVKDLPMDADAITGLTIITANSIGEAQDMAASNPFVRSVRIYEMAGH